MIDLSREISISEEEYAAGIVRYQHALNRVNAEVENIIDDIERSAGRKVIYRTSNRIKTLSSLREKCNRKKLPPGKIDDIAGAKIVVLFEDDIEIVCELLRNAFAVKQEDDYIEAPKANGYRAVHMTVIVKTTVNQRFIQVPVEFQIKTALADALWSMEHVVKYKNNAPDPKAGDIITAAAERINELGQSMIKFRDYASER